MKPLLTHNMTHKVVTVKRNVPAHEAQAIMRNQLIRHLPVVDEAGELVIGMLSDRDLLRSPHPDKPVYELMSSPILSFDINTPMLVVASAMVERKMSAFLVTNDSEIEGIVTSEDLILLLIDILKKEPSPKWILSDFLVNPMMQKVLSAATPAGY